MLPRSLPLLAALVLLASPLASLAGHAAPPSTAPPALLASGPVADRIVVGFRGSIPQDAEPWVQAQGGQVLLRNEATHWVSAKFGDAASAEAALQAAKLRPDVRWAEHDHYTSLLAVPNDPYYGYQWGYAAIRAPQAWDITTGSHAVKVSVVDTGITLSHPDLQGNLCGPFTSFVEGEPTIADGHGHGTHVSGTIAAVSNNGQGVAGTSQSCLMGAKVLSAGGFGLDSWVASGITWSADHGADIISMSLGGPDADTALAEAETYAYTAHGTLIVAAAGNSGCNGVDTVLYPAKYPESVAVAALDYPGTVPAWFSSCGPKVEVAAPGVSILSTWPGGYAWLSGTSMATPHVSGVAALLKARLLQGLPIPPKADLGLPAPLPSTTPGATALALRCLLDLSTEEVGAPGRDLRTGWGRIDALDAANLGGLGPGFLANARGQTILKGCIDETKAVVPSPSELFPGLPPLPPLPLPLTP